VKGRQNILEPISAEEAVQQERREIIQEIRRHAQDRGIANSKEQRAYLDGLAFAVRLINLRGTEEPTRLWAR